MLEGAGHYPLEQQGSLKWWTPSTHSLVTSPRDPRDRGLPDRIAPAAAASASAGTHTAPTGRRPLGGGDRILRAPGSRHPCATWAAPPRQSMESGESSTILLRLSFRPRPVDTLDCQRRRSRTHRQTDRQTISASMSRFALSIVKPAVDDILSGTKQVEIRSRLPPKIPMRDLVLVQNTIFLRRDGQEDRTASPSPWSIS